MSSVAVKKRFLEILHTQIFSLIDEIKTLVPPNKQSVWMLVKYFFLQMSDEDIMGHIITTVLPYKKQIFDEDEQFFISDKNIFGELPPEEVEYVKNMVKKDGLLSPEDKQQFWEYFKVLITIAEGYKKSV
jgi:murein L,D-transpeptidase YafK